ncbi:DNA-processing protein DprA [Pedobacter metabolipauper]|uniref:DNA processing protein n=1 Tax=Pedobacter metabolipauper TaxID=425513 RepID=A0A4R6STU5_9SPHI|nr:DNA-processing protein DprA [Pedobacter metabolipauper]TDQ07046.1 DNA processing protein [Pedobacter metabolipauper]
MSLIHKIALTFIRSVGHVTARNLVSHFGTAEAVFKASKRELIKIPGVGPVTAAQILSNDALKMAGQQIKLIRKYKINVLFYTDEQYPKRLRNCYDAPILLYYRGNADLNHHRMVSIVGTRNATEYGRQLCKQLAEILSAYGVMIVSGLAYGIDIAAHKESLHQNIPTIGILAHGLDRIYPNIHRSIAAKMELNGGLLTEFPIGTIPDKENFPKRNRIIAGISDVTIVVEATAKGGALITADLANSYHRDVYAFPGRTTDLCSEGCNFLIKTNRAALINHAKDLVYYLGWEVVPNVLPNKAAPLEVPVYLTLAEEKIIKRLRTSAAGIDDLLLDTSLPQSKLVLHLLDLEIRGILVSLPGKVYQLLS